jgi:hypothetical protein
MPITGDFAGLGKLEANLRKLGEVPSRAATDASERIAELIEEEFAGQSDPYGDAWATHQQATIDRWGSHDILTLTGDMRSGVTVQPMAGAGISVTFDQDYAVFHHTGTRNMVPRPVLPLETMPATWAAALEEATSAAFDEVMGDL